MTLLLMTEEGNIIAARDRLGRLPVLIGKNHEGYCASFESFAYQKIDYETVYELGPAEIVNITADGYETLGASRRRDEDLRLPLDLLWLSYLHL